MSGVQNVIVFGASGFVGHTILKELLKSSNFKSSAFSRIGGKKITVNGVNIVEGDLENHDSLVKALKGFDVVISAFAGEGLQKQAQIILAAKEAGVRRFVPSDFGYEYSLNIDGRDKPFVHPVIETKRSIKKAIADSGLEYTVIHNGYFIDFAPQPWAPFLQGQNPDNVKFSIPGDGEAKLEWSTVVDTAKFLVASLADPISRNAELKFRGDFKSFNEVADLFEKYSGKKVEREYQPVDELKKLIFNPPQPGLDFLFYIYAAIAEGQFQFSSVANDKFPEIKPETFDTVFRKIFDKRV
ncbi:hypothetical protein K7432_009694 [Basidiobolus ranarum]|uniref:NmrA-like domain-containing protein n=1 Tax=Basidiobolus ranarum TaxID=34480 RepID=A0ABR2VXF9_9FUNG